MKDKTQQPDHKKEIRCYVCGHLIHTTLVAITQDKYRHQSCEPGSSRYLANPTLRKRYQSMFEHQEKHDEQDEADTGSPTGL